MNNHKLHLPITPTYPTHHIPFPIHKILKIHHKSKPKTDHIPPNFDNLTDDGVGGPEKFYRNHFAEGSCRYAYAGKIVRGPRKGTLIVVKKWKQHHVYNDNFWDRDILCHNQCLELVSVWNSLNIINKRYELSLPWMSKCMSSNSQSNEKNKICINEWVLCEEYLNGKFIKFNSNSGYINSHYINASIQAFTHWTYHYS
eukprot:81438_1